MSGSSQNSLPSIPFSFNFHQRTVPVTVIGTSLPTTTEAPRQSVPTPFDPFTDIHAEETLDRRASHQRMVVLMQALDRMPLQEREVWRQANASRPGFNQMLTGLLLLASIARENRQVEEHLRMAEIELERARQRHNNAIRRNRAATSSFLRAMVELDDAEALHLPPLPFSHEHLQPDLPRYHQVPAPPPDAVSAAPPSPHAAPSPDEHFAAGPRVPFTTSPSPSPSLEAEIPPSPSPLPIAERRQGLRHRRHHDALTLRAAVSAVGLGPRHRRRSSHSSHQSQSPWILSIGIQAPSTDSYSGISNTRPSSPEITTNYEAPDPELEAHYARLRALPQEVQDEIGFIDPERETIPVDDSLTVGITEPRPERDWDAVRHLALFQSLPRHRQQEIGFNDPDPAESDVDGSNRSSASSAVSYQIPPRSSPRLHLHPDWANNREDSETEDPADAAPITAGPIASQQWPNWAEPYEPDAPADEDSGDSDQENWHEANDFPMGPA